LFVAPFGQSKRAVETYVPNIAFNPDGFAAAQLGVGTVLKRTAVFVIFMAAIQ
jgi:hypothetical protein